MLAEAGRTAAALLLDHVDSDFRTVGFGKPGLVLESRRDRAVAGFTGDGTVPPGLEDKAWLAKSNCPEIAIDVIEE